MRNYFLFLFFLFNLLACSGSGSEVLKFNGLTMGTTYSIKIITNNEYPEKTQIQAEIDQILTDINQAMSTYIDNSELSILNQTKNTDWQTLSDELFYVIEHANKISTLTNGAFDVTVGPLVNLWGFGPEPFTNEIPSDTVIESIKQHTGYDKLQLSPATKQIVKTDSEIYIDLSGIAKGYAVDAIANYLDETGFTRYLVEVGGELIGKGKNANDIYWQIGIEKVNPLKRSVQRIISLNNIAMATSGDYRNYFEINGIRYSHTINPTTGKPVTHHLASVTVLHESSMIADALATAFMVLGPEKTMALAKSQKLPVYIITKTDSGFEEKYNEYFTPFLSEE